MCVGHLWIFEGEISIQVPWLFYNQVLFICWFLLCYRTSWCMLDINLLSHIWFADITTHSVAFVLCCLYPFNFDVVLFVCFYFCCPPQRINFCLYWFSLLYFLVLIPFLYLFFFLSCFCFIFLLQCKLNSFSVFFWFLM